METRCDMILLLACLALAACGGPRARSGLSLNGGSSAVTDQHSVVRIASGGVSYCAGVLVAPDLVVTAAHCITEELQGDLTVVFPLLEGPKSRPIAEFQKLREDSLLFFPNFDIAWIRLQEPAPAPYEAAEILGDTKQVEGGSLLNLIGTGHDTPCDPGEDPCRLVELSALLKSSWSSPHLVNLAVVDSSGLNDSSGTCPGDSGGPAFLEIGGRALLYGIVAGKDPIFNSSADNSCGSPTSVLTRIGEYQEWLETSSHRRLKVRSPAIGMLNLEFLTGKSYPDATYSAWGDWFSMPRAMDSSWVTVHKILEQLVLKFQPQFPAEDIPYIFQDGGRDWVEKVTELRSFTLGFPYQSIAIEDLRPLAALTSLQDLTFIARRYKGLEVLASLGNLKTLNIIGRVITKPEQGVLAWRDLASSSLEVLRLSQLSVLQMNGIDWNQFPNLQSLTLATPTVGRIPASWMAEEKLGALSLLNVQEFSCDEDEWPKLTMTHLKSLVLRSTFSLPEKELSCIRWDRLPNLTQLSVQGYKINVTTFTAHMPPALAAQLHIAH